MIYRQIETIATCYGFNLTDPIKLIPSEAIAVILKGSKRNEIPSKNSGITRTYNIDFEGLENLLKNIYTESPTASLKDGQMNSWTNLNVKSVLDQD